MNQSVADSVKNLRCIAVNDAFRLAPWAEALAAQDPEWWAANNDAFDFAGDKYSARPVSDSVLRVAECDTISSQSSSGLLGLHVAICRGARRVILMGFDFHGAHYFGAHKEGLANTTPGRFEEFGRQFALYPLRGVKVYNATRGSSLCCFPQIEWVPAC